MRADGEIKESSEAACRPKKARDDMPPVVLMLAP